MLRQGRTTPAQKRALDELLPVYGIPFGERIASRRGAPLVLEIGSGMGETTAAIAKAHPELEFIAIEVHGPGVGALLKQVAEHELKNVRVVRHDAMEVLERMVPDEALAAIHLFFPDPWPKKRHHKRRLVQASFAKLAATKLKEGAILHAATDWPDYAEHMHAMLSAEPLLEPAEKGLVARPLTKFESRGQRLGHPIRDLYFRRRQKARATR
ncbi:MAG TPA: tRNA (guanosine(46)-N7)-methyltransferase TrmB [Burkholderiales bacterium]